MTDQSFEYKALRFLNDRVEVYNITDETLKTALYDIPEYEYFRGMTSLRDIGYISNKELNEKGLTITSQGKVRLQQLQREVDHEKNSTIKENTENNLIVDLLKNPLFWSVLIVMTGAAYKVGYDFGNSKPDRNLIELSLSNRALQDTIKHIRHNSDSALNILGHMPYNEMSLDTHSWRKIQTTIENAGGALSLNK